MSTCNIEQFRRYTVEVLAFTFNADMSALQSAMCLATKSKEGKVPRYSILSTKERADLLNLSHLVRKLHKKITSNELDTTNKSERDLLFTALVKPARALHIPAGFALDFISTYADHECRPKRWKYTLVGHYTPRWFHIRGTLRYWNYRAALGTHSNMIGAVAPTEHVKHILGRAQQAFEVRKNGKAGFRLSYWPTRQGFYELGWALEI